LSAIDWLSFAWYYGVNSETRPLAGNWWVEGRQAWSSDAEIASALERAGREWAE